MLYLSFHTYYIYNYYIVLFFFSSSRLGAIACSFEKGRLFCSHKSGSIGAIVDSNGSGSILDGKGRSLFVISEQGAARVLDKQVVYCAVFIYVVLLCV